ncbi:MAG TPA: trypsin-like serine protease [Polyangiaceae bacterium]|nr:trypsin-like serine protease [Polyangiaceae bacterium]
MKATRIALIFGCAVSACSAAEPRADDAAGGCVSTNAPRSSEPLIHGAASADYLALSDAQRGAIGQLRAPNSESTCTAVRIAPHWLLSARHCTALGQAQFLGDDGEHGRVVEWVPHPELDLALARLQPTTCSSSLTLPLAEPGVDAAHLSRATLAGYGLNERDQVGELAFLVEEVVAIDDTTVTVDGFERSGACVGDSGGPLLVRDLHGGVAVLALLSVGSSSCVGTDVYVRVDLVRDWVRSHVALPATSDECGKIDARGRCFEQQAVWCAGDKLVSVTCGADSPCGFDELEAGFRCTSSARCPNDEFGRCRAGKVERCSDGEPFVESCGSSGLTCSYDPESGTATCL